MCKLKKVVFICLLMVNTNFFTSCETPIKSNETSKSLASKSKPDLKTFFEKQNIEVNDTIKITEKEFSKKIIFSKEVLHWNCKETEIECSIDAHEFINYLKQDVFEVHNPRLVSEFNLFTKAELENNLVDLQNNLKKHFAKKDSYTVTCVNQSEIVKLHKILDDENYAIHRILSYNYFWPAMGKGEVKFYHKNLNQHCDELYKVVEENEYSKTITFYLDLEISPYYSTQILKENKQKMLDAKKKENE